MAHDGVPYVQDPSDFSGAWLFWVEVRNRRGRQRSAAEAAGLAAGGAGGSEVQ